MPENARVWQAFQIVESSRVMLIGMTAVIFGGFDWSAVKARLEVHDLWDLRIERGLAVCETEMMLIDAEVRNGQEGQSWH
jgi:anti-sigma factor RsiW